jgi:hypothetical protein
MFIDGNSSNYTKVIDKWQPVVCADILGEPESGWDYRLELSTALHARQTIKPFKQFLKGVAIRLGILFSSWHCSQFDKEAVDIKFDTVEGFLLIDQILHRKTFNYEIRHSKYTSDSSRIGMRVSEGPQLANLVADLSAWPWHLQTIDAQREEIPSSIDESTRDGRAGSVLSQHRVVQYRWGETLYGEYWIDYWGRSWVESSLSRGAWIELRGIGWLVFYRWIGLEGDSLFAVWAYPSACSYIQASQAWRLLSWANWNFILCFDCSQCIGREC